MGPRISSRQRPILCAVLDGRSLGPKPDRYASELFRGGVDWIQLRDRELEADALYEIATTLVEVGQRIASAAPPARDEEPGRDRPRVIVNRRVDVALAARADGVHLGFDAIDPSSARDLLGEDALIGASFHAADEIARCLDGPGGPALSYGHLAPIWDPRSKTPTRAPLGPTTLRAAAERGLPLLAQGGIDPERAGEAMRAGATGVAVTGLLMQTPDPFAAAAGLRRGLDAVVPPQE